MKILNFKEIFKLFYFLFCCHPSNWLIMKQDRSEIVFTFFSLKISKILFKDIKLFFLFFFYGLNFLDNYYLKKKKLTSQIFKMRFFFFFQKVHEIRNVFYSSSLLSWNVLSELKKYHYSFYLGPTPVKKKNT